MTKFIICAICRLEIEKDGTFNAEFGACHKTCLTQKLLWREKVAEFEAMK